MKKSILIATACRPKSARGVAIIFDVLKKSAVDDNCLITKAFWCEGKGCSNLAFEIVGKEGRLEKFANAVTMVLMPSKWCETPDEIPEGFTHELNWEKISGSL